MDTSNSSTSLARNNDPILVPMQSSGTQQLSEIASIITIGEFIAEMLRKENDDAASDFNAFLEGIKKNRLMGRIV